MFVLIFRNLVCFLISPFLYGFVALLSELFVKAVFVMFRNWRDFFIRKDWVNKLHYLQKIENFAIIKMLTYDTETSSQGIDSNTYKTLFYNCVLSESSSVKC